MMNTRVRMLISYKPNTPLCLHAQICWPMVYQEVDRVLTAYLETD